jgi:hypothetical protein
VLLEVVLRLLTMRNTLDTLSVSALFLLTAILMGFGVWMLAVQDRTAGLIPIAFALFNVAVGIFSLQRRR